MDHAREVIQHKDGNCIGRWNHICMESEKGRVVICDTCGVMFPATPENRIEAIDENRAGTYLQRLTAEGISQSE